MDYKTALGCLLDSWLTQVSCEVIFRYENPHPKKPLVETIKFDEMKDALPKNVMEEDYPEGEYPFDVDEFVNNLEWETVLFPVRQSRFIKMEMESLEDYEIKTVDFTYDCPDGFRLKDLLAGSTMVLNDDGGCWDGYLTKFEIDDGVLYVYFS